MFGTAIFSQSYLQAIIGRTLQAFGRSVAIIIGPVMIKDIGKSRGGNSSFIGSIFPAGFALGSLFSVILSLKNILGIGFDWAYFSFVISSTQFAVLILGALIRL